MSSKPVYTKLKSFILTKQTPRELARKRSLQRRYGHLTRWFNEELQINYYDAISCLKRLYDRELKSGNQPNEKKKQLSPQERYFLRKISLDKFHRKDFDYEVDDTSRRFHSNLTSLKSELRNYITYEGQRLCSVDVKNSQPFLSTVFFNPTFYSKKNENFNLISIAPAVYNQLQNVIPKILNYIGDITTITMLVKDDEKQCQSDLELYCTLVDKGRLYPYLNTKFYEETGNKFNLDIAEEKKQLKQWFFWILYSENTYIPWEDKGKFRAMFRKLFPTVYAIFSLVKRKDHRSLPVILQTVESEIIINRVTRNLSKELPGLPLFTVHDSVVSLAGCEQIIRERLKMEFDAAIGLEPSLQPEIWEDEERDNSVILPELVEI